jgi:hypothetical protein
LKNILKIKFLLQIVPKKSKKYLEGVSENLIQISKNKLHQKNDFFSIFMAELLLDFQKFCEFKTCSFSVFLSLTLNLKILKVK